MRKIIYLTFLVTFTSLSYSQTKEETKNWIEKETFNHRLMGDLTFTNYFIKDGFIIEESYQKHKGSFIFWNTAKIPIKNIYLIEIDKSQSGYIFNLKCKNDCVSYRWYDYEEKLKEQYLSQTFSIQIDQNDPSLLDRLPKSLIHLVNLYGGKAKLIPMKKDPF